MELTPEDKTRIEKQAGWFEDTHPYDALHEAYYEGAEYATIYEREKQAKEIERLSIRDLQKENRRLKKLNEYLESILTKKQDRTYEHYKVLTEHLDETED